MKERLAEIERVIKLYNEDRIRVNVALFRISTVIGKCFGDLIID